MKNRTGPTIKARFWDRIYQWIYRHNMSKWDIASRCEMKKKPLQTFRRLLTKLLIWNVTKREAFWHVDVKNTRLCKSVLPCFYHPPFQWCLPHFVQFLFKILIFTDQEHVYMSLCPKKTDSRIKEKSSWRPFSVDLSDNSCLSVPQSPRVYGSAAGNTPGGMKSWSIFDLLQRYQQKGHIYIDAKCMCVCIYI